MATWADLTRGNPAIAKLGRELLYRTGSGEALLATVRGDGLPRIHPIAVGIVSERVVAFINDSAKRRDLERDGRYALHSHLDLQVPHELELRGRVHLVADGQLRAEAAAGWSFEVDDGYRLFELDIEHALIGERASRNAWPPSYTSWRADPSADRVPG
ncbi:MAG: pyridoxamine 5'-phosphate oxidase family protein [Chloroflexota bacterium]